MKYLTIFLCSIPLIINAQSSQELDKYKSELKDRSQEYFRLYELMLDSIEIIEKQIKLTKAKEFGLNPQRHYINETVILQGLAPLREEPKISSESVMNGGYKEVYVTEILDEDWTEIRYNNRTYYAATRNIPQTTKVKEALNNISLMKYAYLEEKKKEIAEQKRIEDSISQVKREKERLEWEQQVEENARIQARQDKIRAEEIKKRNAERRKLMIQKYGQSNGTKISEGKIWVGMTENMLYDSWGAPNDKNITVTSYGKREQWVCAQGKYVYLKDGVVASFQY